MRTLFHYWLRSPLFLYALVYLFCFLAWGQSGQKELEKRQRPDNTLQDLRNFEQQRRLRKLEDQQVLRKEQAKFKQGQRPSKGKKFLVKRIVVNKSGILSRDEINKIIKHYQGKYLNISDLRQIVRELNTLYEKKVGSISRAVLPPQKIKNGIVKIILIESKIGKVTFENNGYTLDSYLSWVIPLNETDITNLKDMERLFVQFNKTHNSARILTNLKPGKKFSQTDIIIKIKESPRFNGNAFIDNNGPKSTGELRYGLTLQDNALIGIDDQLILGGTKTSGTTTWFSSYEFPFTPVGTRLKGIYSTSKQKIEQGSFSDLNIAGESVFISGKITHPLLINKNWKIDINLEHNQNKNENLFSIYNLSSEFKKNIFGITVQKYDTFGAWMGSTAYHRSQKQDYTNDNPTTDQNYSKWAMALTRYQVLSQKFSLVANLASQYSSDFTLPVTDQFQLGGRNNLAYEASQFSGDRGYSLGVELHYDLPWEKYLPRALVRSDFKLFGSLQHGEAFPYYSSGKPVKGDYSAQSIALGLRSTIVSSASWSLTFAQPLKAKHSDLDTRSVLFSLQGNL